MRQAGRRWCSPTSELLGGWLRNLRKVVCMSKGTDQVEFAQRLDQRQERKTPTAFVATCQCGHEVGALDVERTGSGDTARLLGMWLMQGCTVAPRFTANWSARIEMCECSKTPNVVVTRRHNET
jgi:hypothetical protein